MGNEWIAMIEHFECKSLSESRIGGSKMAISHVRELGASRPLRRWLRLALSIAVPLHIRRFRANVVPRILLIASLTASLGHAQNTFTSTVPATANIFTAGSGLAPAATFTAAAGQTLTFQNVAGTVYYGPSDPNGNGPNGQSPVNPAAETIGSNFNSQGGISGFVDVGNVFFLVGVFLDDSAPSGAPPPILDFTGNEHPLTQTPLIGQTFFVGTGVASAGGPTQFHVPPTATRLFLGFGDGDFFTGNPKDYGDNSGSVIATFSVSNCQISLTTTFRQSDPPTLFGFLPNPNSLGYQQCRTQHSGCALTSSATMLSTFSSIETPAAIDQYLTSVLPLGSGYGKGCLKGGEPPCGPAPDGNDWAEFGPSWSFLPYVNPFNSIALVDSGATVVADPDDYLNSHVCQDQDRVILELEETQQNLTTGQVSTGKHFVFVTGRTSNGNDWKVFDPGWTNAPPTLSGHLNGFTTENSRGTQTFRKFTIFQAKTYKSFGSTPDSVIITANSPVELLVYDPLGRRLGDVGGTAAFEIPLGSYIRDFPLLDDDGDGLANGEESGLKNITIPSPTQGLYTLSSTGSAPGRFTLTFTLASPNGVVQTPFSFSGITALNATATYQFGYNSVAGMLSAPVLIASSTGTVPPNQISTISSGLAYSRVRQTFTGTITVSNISDATINGPLQIALASLTPGVSLSNATNTFGGLPYITVSTRATLDPGQSATVDLEFRNPLNVVINFTPIVYSGSLN